MVKKIFFAILFLLFIQSYLFGIEPLKSKTGELAVNFILLDLNGKQVSLFDYKDKPVILFFWTTWCPFCRDELRVLQNIHSELVKEGWELFAINAGESSYKIDNFLKKYFLTFKVLLDTDTNIARAYKIIGVPTYILIDKKGYIVFKGHYFPQDAYKDLISK